MQETVVIGYSNSLQLLENGIVRIQYFDHFITVIVRLSDVLYITVIVRISDVHFTVNDRIRNKSGFRMVNLGLVVKWSGIQIIGYICPVFKLLRLDRFIIKSFLFMTLFYFKTV
jgi:hypothetical protein